MSGTFGTPSNGAAFNFVGGAAAYGQGGGTTPPDTLDPGQTTSRDYRFDPLITGDFVSTAGGAFSILGRDANDPNATTGTIVGEEFYRLEGVGVAPEYSDNVGGNLAVNVRTGGTADVPAFTIENTGNGNTAVASTDSGIFNLDGTADGTTGTFADITGAAVGFNLTDASTLAIGSGAFDVVAGSTRTMGTPETLTLVDTTNGASGSNAALSSALTVDVNVVGPDSFFDVNATSEADHSDEILADGSTLTGGDTLTFPETSVGSTSAIRIDVSNLSSDGDLGTLTDLSYNAIISGIEFGFGDTGGSGDFVVNVGESGEFFDITFSPTAIADFNGTLTFLTDQGVDFGGTGLSFTVNLFGTGIAVPEPASLLLWSLLGLVAAGAVTLRRRKK